MRIFNNNMAHIQLRDILALYACKGPIPEEITSKIYERLLIAEDQPFNELDYYTLTDMIAGAEDEYLEFFSPEAVNFLQEFEEIISYEQCNACSLEQIEEEIEKLRKRKEKLKEIWSSSKSFDNKGIVQEEFKVLLNIDTRLSQLQYIWQIKKGISPLVFPDSSFGR